VKRKLTGSTSTTVAKPGVRAADGKDAIMSFSLIGTHNNCRT
jgi:hypothetical protein